MESAEDRVYIEAIKFAASFLQYKELSIKQTFRNVISQLYWYYKNLDSRKYLEIATLHMQAYLEMGFSYEENKDIFDLVLEELGMTREMKFPKKFYVAQKIKLNKSQVRHMIKKWPASPYQKMKINEVVEDIITKVKNKDNGIFYYKCAVTGDVYELVISEKETFFHDMVRGIFYTFID